jgi:hypothetical protein
VDKCLHHVSCAEGPDLQDLCQTGYEADVGYACSPTADERVESLVSKGVQETTDVILSLLPIDFYPYRLLSKANGVTLDDFTKSPVKAAGNVGKLCGLILVKEFQRLRIQRHSYTAHLLRPRQCC